MAAFEQIWYVEEITDEVEGKNSADIPADDDDGSDEDDGKHSVAIKEGGTSVGLTALPGPSVIISSDGESCGGEDGNASSVEETTTTTTTSSCTAEKGKKPRKRKKKLRPHKIERPQQTMQWNAEIITATEDTPSARGGCTWTLVQRNQLVLFGGADMNQQSFSDVIVLDLVSQLWRRPPCTGKGPAARGGHVATAAALTAPRGTKQMTKTSSSNKNEKTYHHHHHHHGYQQGKDEQENENIAVEDETGQRYLIVYGGMTYEESADYPAGSTFNDVFVLDTLTWHWTELQTKNAPPRNSAAGAFVPHLSALVVFGGAAPDGPTNDVYVLDLKGLHDVIDHSSGGGGGGGGDGGNGDSGSSQSVLHRTFKWTRMSCRGHIPGAREMASACLAVAGGGGENGGGGGGGGGGESRGASLIVMGGRSAEGQVFNDVYSLDVDSWQWTQLADAPVPRCAHTTTVIRLATTAGQSSAPDIAGPGKYISTVKKLGSEVYCSGGGSGDGGDGGGDSGGGGGDSGGGGGDSGGGGGALEDDESVKQADVGGMGAVQDMMDKGEEVHADSNSRCLVVVFGGWDGSADFSNAMLMYDVSKNQWQEMVITNVTATSGSAGGGESGVGGVGDKSNGQAERVIGRFAHAAAAAVTAAGVRLVDEGCGSLWPIQHPVTPLPEIWVFGGINPMEEVNTVRLSLLP